MIKDPLEQIGMFFEMPNKEAWLNKIDPVLAFQTNLDIGVMTVIYLIGAIALGAFIFRRVRG